MSYINGQKAEIICPYYIPQIIDESFDNITKTFILFDRNINFTGVRDPSNPAFFLLDQINIYQSGNKEYITHRLTDAQVNELFYRLDNLDQNNSLNRVMYIGKKI